MFSQLRKREASEFKVFLRQDSTSQRQSVALGVSMGRIMKFTLRAEAHWPPTRKSF
jgi:hypothetical protein